jgi:acyl-CoA synthetase (AMP-forming)/AMP-acid ligase II
VEVKCVPLPDSDTDSDTDSDKELESVLESGFEGALEGPGELLVRGPGVFKEYWGRPDVTADSFDDEAGSGRYTLNPKH